MGYSIIDSDIHNMDESGTGLGTEQKSKVILPREEKKHFTKKASNHEWVTLIECISAIGECTPGFLVVKGHGCFTTWLR
jgi:hypothetical protein